VPVIAQESADSIAAHSLRVHYATLPIGQDANGNVVRPLNPEERGLSNRLRSNVGTWLRVSLPWSADAWPTIGHVRYAYRPVLLETFVDKPRFTGTCYCATNWQYLRGHSRTWQTGYDPSLRRTHQERLDLSTLSRLPQASLQRLDSQRGRRPALSACPAKVVCNRQSAGTERLPPIGGRLLPAPLGRTHV
jgi:hypothetical protein